jgi:hypothetical protein
MAFAEWLRQLLMYNKSLSPSRRLTKQSRSRTVTREPTNWCPGSLGALITSAAYERWLTLNLIDAERDIRGNITRKTGTTARCPGSRSRQHKATRLSRLNPTRRRCLPASSAAHPLLPFPLFPSFFPLNITPSLLWLHSLRMSPTLPHSRNRHP